jgi:hypothetical protein
MSGLQELPFLDKGEALTGEWSVEALTASGKVDAQACGWPTLTIKRDLNFSNRPVRTRMPGGVAGDPRVYTLGPQCRFPHPHLSSPANMAPKLRL